MKHGKTTYCHFKVPFVHPFFRFFQRYHLIMCVNTKVKRLVQRIKGLQSDLKAGVR